MKIENKKINISGKNLINKSRLIKSSKKVKYINRHFYSNKSNDLNKLMINLKYFNHFPLDKDLEIIKTFIDERDLFNCTFNYKLPSQKDTTQYGTVIIHSTKPKIIKEEELKKGYNNFFNKLEKETTPYKIYKGLYVEQINNCYILKSTN